MKKKYKCFVIMSFGKNDTDKDFYNKLFTKAIQASSSRLIDKEVIFDRADISLNEFELTKNVHKHLDNAHICIADISGLNPNVLYEIGYAIAKEKEVIIITKDDGPFPVDIANMIITKYSFQKDDDFDYLSQKLAFLIDKALTQSDQKKYIIKGSYYVKCFHNRKTAELTSAFQNANEMIDLLHTNLDTIENEYIDSLEKAVSNNPNLKLRILCLDPESYFATKRAEQLGLQIAHYRNQLHQSIRSVSCKLAKFGNQFSLRLYDDFPTQSTFLIDQSIYVCTVARNIKSRELCTFMLEKHAGGVERSFLFHFNATWSNGYEYKAHTITERANCATP